MVNDQKKISVITICYNEESNILPMYERLKKTLEPEGYPFEIIYVDNNSDDNSLSIYENLCAQDRRVKIILMSRNFGYSQSSYFAGLKYCSGDCAILLDGDLQDPPELIPKFLRKWEEDFDVVYGVRHKRQASLIWQVLYKLFYRVFRKLAYVPVPVDASDFGLIDRKVINQIIKFNERDIFIRGVRPYIGFKQTGIEYERTKRLGGKTTQGFFRGLLNAKRLIINFSYKPLEWISNFAFLIMVLAFVAILVYMVAFFWGPTPPSGIPTLIVFILFFSGVQLLAISVIGEYLAKIFEEVKHRPRFIVRKILNDDREVGLVDD